MVMKLYEEDADAEATRTSVQDFMSPTPDPEELEKEEARDSVGVPFLSLLAVMFSSTIFLSRILVIVLQEIYEDESEFMESLRNEVRRVHGTYVHAPCLYM